MRFEWDEPKRRKNWAVHGVDFAEAALIFEGPVLEAPDRRISSEVRLRALGQVGGHYFVVVYTWRAEARRIISAWKAGRHAQARYQAVYPRTT